MKNQKTSEGQVYHEFDGNFPKPTNKTLSQERIENLEDAIQELASKGIYYDIGPSLVLLENEEK